MAVNPSTGFCDRLLGGQSFESIFQDGCIEVRTGAQPADADQAPTGTLLGRITRDGLTWTAGSPTGGLRYETNGRYAIKQPDHIWTLTGIAAGTAGWFRMLPNASDSGLLSAVAPRIDGAIALLATPGDTQFFMNNTTIALASAHDINNWYYVMPPVGE